MKRAITILICILSFASCGSKNVSNTSKKTVGVLNTLAHPSLEMVYQGIVEQLGDEYEVDLKVANGEATTANLAANNFKAKNYDYVIGIGTLAAQSLANNITEKPVVYAAVSDPVAAGLTGDNVIGISDKVTTIDKQIQLLKDKFDNIKKIGVIYNTSELNSISQIKDLEQVASQMDVEIIKGGITNASELPQVTKSLIERVDALYIPLDNLVVANILYIIDIANENKIPIAASESSSVEKGCLFSIGVDYLVQGNRAGQIVKDLDNGIAIDKINVDGANDTKIFFNEDTAKLLDIRFGD